MTQTQIKNYNEISKLFVFDDVEGDEQQAFLEEVGTLVFQSALMKYLSEITEEESFQVEEFISENVTQESFINLLCAEYPQFEVLLVEEMKNLSGEFSKE
jgi:hypothetical protein